MLPSINDLVLYINKIIKGADWNTNFRAVLNWFTNGQYNAKVKGIEVGSDGITNNGTFTQSGNLAVSGNIEATGSITAGNGGFVGDGSRLTGIVSSSVVSYTPFCANSGYTNSGNAEILYYSGSTLKFKVGGTNPTYPNLVCTSAKGVTFTMEQVLDVDCSSKDDGTYIVCVEKGTGSYSPNARLFRNAKIYVQPNQPSGQENDIWLNTAKEGLKSYQKVSGSWNNGTELVPIGEVVISSNTISSVKTYFYNQNGYNINLGKCKNLFTREEAPSVVIRSWSSERSFYRIWSNGYVEQGGYVIRTDASRIISFPIKMANTNYSITSGHLSQYYEADEFSNLTTEGMHYWNDGGSDASCLWKVEGMMDINDFLSI